MQPRSTFYYAVWEISTQAGLNARNVIVNTHNAERISLHIIIRMVLPVYFSKHNVQ
jgi:hypothetical protein